MIFLLLVGGGGSANPLSFTPPCCAAELLLLALTVSAACIGYAWLVEVECAGDVGLGCCLPSSGETRATSCIAGGGSSKDMWRVFKL